MSNELGPLNIATLGKMTEDDARAMLERLRWPDGPICPHCGVVGEATRMESREGTDERLRDGVLNCRACRKPFSVTVGTIFEGSHIPLSKWLIGFFLFSSAKKSMSALQLQRQLGLGSYRTAWHMAHRIRHAMQNDPFPGKLAGEVEVDETYIQGKPRNKTDRVTAARRRREDERPVAVLVSRDGKARARAVENVTGETLRAFIMENVDVANATLNTDEWKPYKKIGREFKGGHRTVNHRSGEYARGEAHNNTAESFNGLFKRSINGSWHHISREHAGRYLDEQCFRWSNKKVSDTERTMLALGRVDGVRLYYKQPRRQAEDGDASLVAGG